jgi:chaperonin GroES
MKTIQAVNDKIFVKMLKQDEKTKGGLFVPEIAQKEPQAYGTVLSFGSDVKGQLKVNDIAVFHSRAGQVVLLDGEEYRIIMNTEIYGVMKDKE